MIDSDQDLLRIYMQGFNDCLANKHDHSTSTSSLEKQAYRLGWEHAIIGDDIRSVDYLSNQEILDLIHNPPWK